MSKSWSGNANTEKLKNFVLTPKTEELNPSVPQLQYSCDYF